MAKKYDVVIAGGGVIGSACAYFLGREPGFGGSIAVIEPDPTYAKAASTLSASSIRRQFSSPINIAISGFGMQFLREASQYLAGADSANVGLVEGSYLYLATARGRDSLEHCIRIQKSAGVAVTLHERGALSARYPWLNTDDLVAGSDTIDGEGWFDGYALLSALRRINERNDVHYIRDRVTRFELADDRRVVAASLESGERLACGHAVNAAGTHSRDLAATAGIELPVFARKRSVFVFTCPQPIARCPLVIDPSGLWFRPERDRFLCGAPANPDPDVSAEDFDVQHELFESEAWPILAHRVPAFESIRMTAAWAGHYDFNHFDQNAFVGPVPGIPNLLLASGFSGHGLQQAPAIGRGLAEYIAFGAYRSLDLRSLSYARYPANQPLRELNII